MPWILENVDGDVLLCYINKKQAQLFFLSVSFVIRLIKFQDIMELIIGCIMSSLVD
jgi:hypothetical protein